DTMVIACSRCQTSRQDNPQWVDDHPLRPAPASPNYGKWTAAYLTEHGYPTEPNIGPEQVIDPTRAQAAPTAPQAAPRAPQAAQERRAATPGAEAPPEPPQARPAPPEPPNSDTRSLGTSKPG